MDETSEKSEQGEGAMTFGAEAVNGIEASFEAGSWSKEELAKVIKLAADGKSDELRGDFVDAFVDFTAEALKKQGWNVEENALAQAQSLVAKEIMNIAGGDAPYERAWGKTLIDKGFNLPLGRV